MSALTLVNFQSERDVVYLVKIAEGYGDGDALADSFADVHADSESFVEVEATWDLGFGWA